MKRILIYTGRFPARSETFIIDHVRSCVENGWDVAVAANEIGELSDLKSALAGVRLVKIDHGFFAFQALRGVLWLKSNGIPHGVSRTLIGAASRAQGLAEAISAVNPDVIYSHFGANGLAAALATRHKKRPLVVNFHGTDVTVLPKREGWSIYQHLPPTTVAVAHSEFVERLLRRHTSLTVKRVPLGVDLSLFHPSAHPNLWPQPIRILSVGRLVKQKGFAVAIDALAAIKRDRLFSFTYEIIGDGVERRSLEAQVARNNLGDVVRLLGAKPYDQVAKAMNSSTVLLIPSLVMPSGSEEAFSRVAIEGMAAGMVVVGTRTGGLPDTLGAGGVVVPPNSPDALAKVLAEVVLNSSPDDHRARARNRAEQFSLQESWRAYERVTRSVARL